VNDNARLHRIRLVLETLDLQEIQHFQLPVRSPTLPRGCSREPSASIFPTKVTLRALSSDYVNPSLRPPGDAGS
jgi:hypothetical protein